MQMVHQVSWTATYLYGVVYLGHVFWCLGRGYPLNPVKYLFLAASYFLWYFLAWQTASLLMYMIGSKLMHGMQYIVIVHWYIRRKVARSGQRRGLLAHLARPGKVIPFWIPFLSLAAVYAVVFNMIVGRGLEEFGFGVVNIMLPYDNLAELGLRRLSGAQRFDWFAGTVIQSAALVHYYFDSFIWKVREANVQSGL